MEEAMVIVDIPIIEVDIPITEMVIPITEMDLKTAEVDIKTAEVDIRITEEEVSNNQIIEIVVVFHNKIDKKTKLNYFWQIWIMV